MRSRQVASKVLINLVLVFTLLSEIFVAPIMAIGDKHAGRAKARSSHHLSVLPHWYTAPTSKVTTIDPAFYLSSGPLPNGELPIATTPDPELSSDIACDNHNNCLTVWEAHTEPPPSFDSDIQGRLITGYGEMDVILSLGPDSDSTTQCYPSVTYNSDREEFFVVYSEGSGCRSNAVALMGQRVSFITETAIYTPTSLGVVGQYVDIAYVPSANSYLVVYDDGSSVESLWLDAVGQPATASFNLTVQASLFARVASGDDGVFVVWNRKSSGYLPPSIYGCYMEAGALDCDSNNFRISETFYKTESPDVAYDTASDQAIAVWREYNGLTYDIYGRILTTDTAQMGANFLIGAADSSSEPAVAYHPQDNVFLVAWAVDGTLRGQYVSTDGMLLDLQGQSGSEFFDIGASADDIRRPGLAVNQATGLFLTSWTKQIFGSREDIYGRYVESVMPHDLAVLATRGAETQPTVVHNPHTDQYLFAAVDTSVVTSTLVARFADVNESYLETQPITLPLSSSAAYTQPVLTFIPGPGGADNHYALAVTAIFSDDSDIHVFWIDESGNVTETTSITGSDSQMHPAITYNDAAERVILVWQQSSGVDQSQIWRRVLDTAGAIIGNDVLVSDNAYIAMHPTIASDEYYNLIAWERSVGANNQDIAVRKIHGNGALISGQNARGLINDSFEDQTDPELVYNGLDYILAWHDTSDHSIHTAPVHDSETIIPGPSNRLFDATLSQCGPPAIAARPAPGGQETYVVASCVATDTSMIYAHRLDTTGSPIGNDLVISHDPDQGDQYVPALTHNTSDNYTFFIWSDERFGNGNVDIFGRLYELSPDLSTSTFDVSPPIEAPSNWVDVTLVISNLHGLIDANGVEAVIDLPSEIIDVRNLSGCTYDSTPREVRWQGTVPDLEEVKCQFEARIGYPLDDGTLLTFTTNISASLVPSFTLSDVVEIGTWPDLKADLAVKPYGSAGETLTYTLAITNAGNTAPEVEAVCSIPSSTIEYPSTVTFNFGPLSLNEYVSDTYQAETVVPAPEVQSLTSHCTVTVPGPVQPTIVSVTTIISSAVDFSTSSLLPEQPVVEPGDFITYTITITNNGTLTATNDYFMGSVPNYTTFITDSVTGTTYVSSTNMITYAFKSPLSVGESDNITVVVQVADVLTDTYGIIFDGEFGASNLLLPYQISSTVMISSSPELTMTLFNYPVAPQQACDTFEYGVHVDNVRGNADVTGVVFTFTVFVPTSYTVSTAPRPYTSPLTNTFVVDLGNIPAQILTHTLDVDVDLTNLITDDETLGLEFWLDSDQTDPISDMITSTIRSLCLRKSDVPDPVNVLGELGYTVAITSWAPYTLNTVLMTDTIPNPTTHITYESCQPSSCTQDEQSVTWQYTTLTSWQTETQSINVGVKPYPGVWYTALVNSVQASADEALPVQTSIGTTVWAPDFRRSWTRAQPRNTLQDAVYEEIITYYVYVRNTGRLIGTNVSVSMTVPLPGQIDFIGNSPICQRVSNEVHCQLPQVNTGQTIPLTFTIRTRPYLSDNTNLPSYIAIDNAQIPAPVNLTQIATYRARPNFGFFTKEVTPTGPVDPGTVLEYTLTLTNTGDEIARNTVITDRIPLGTQNPEAISSPGVINGDIISWDIGDLEPGDSRQYTYRVTTTAEGVVNQAFACCDQLGCVPSTVASNALMEMTMTASPDPVQAGEQLTFTFVIENLNPLAPIANVTLTEWLPNDVRYGASGPGDTVVWILETLAAGDTVTHSLVVTVNLPLPNNTLIENTHYQVDCGSCISPVPGDPVYVTVRSQEQLRVDLSASPPVTLPVGSSVRYTATLINTGNEDTDEAEIALTLPAELTFVNCNQCIPQENRYFWTGMNVPVGITQTVVITAYAPYSLADGQVITLDDYAATGPNGPATVGDPVVHTAIAPIITWTTHTEPTFWGDGLMVPGRPATYTFDITNVGSMAATDINVTNIYPVEFLEPRLFGPRPESVNLSPGQTLRWQATGLVDKPLDDDWPLTDTLIFAATNLAAPVRITVTTAITNAPDLGPSALSLVDRYAEMPPAGVYSYTKLLTYTARLVNDGTTAADPAWISFTEQLTHVQYISNSLQWPIDWTVTPHTGGFQATGAIPEDEERVFTFTLRVNLLNHEKFDEYQEIVVAPTVAITAHRQPPLLPLQTIHHVHDTRYRPELCALPYVNDGTETNENYFAQLFNSYQVRREDAQKIYSQFFSTAPIGGICDGLSVASALYFARDRLYGREYDWNWPETCDLWDENSWPERLNWYEEAVHWQGAQIASNLMLQKVESLIAAPDFVRYLQARLAQADGHYWRGNPIILTLEYKMDSCNIDEPVVHSVFPYRVVMGDDNVAYVYVYDSNYAKDYSGSLPNVLNRYVTVDMSTGEWSYPFNGTQIWHGNSFRYVDVDQYRTFLELPIHFTSDGYFINGARTGYIVGNARTGYIVGNLDGEAIVCGADEKMDIDIDGAYIYRHSAGYYPNPYAAFRLPEGYYTYNSTIRQDPAGNLNEATIYGPRSSLAITGTQIANLNISWGKFEHPEWGVTERFNIARQLHPVKSFEAITTTIYKHDVDNTHQYTYTMAFTLTGAPLQESRELTLTAYTDPVGPDRFEIILDPTATKNFTYTIDTSWEAIDFASQAYRVSKLITRSQVITPGARHVLLVRDREDLDRSVICIDSDNDGRLDNCLDVGATAQPKPGNEVFKLQPVDYMAVLTNTSEGTLSEVSLIAPMPENARFITATLCDYQDCWPQSLITQTQQVTATYPGLLGEAGKNVLTLTVSVEITGAVGDIVSFRPYGSSELIDRLPGPTVTHRIANRPPCTPTFPIPMDGSSGITLTQVLSWDCPGDDPDRHPLTYIVTLSDRAATEISSPLTDTIYTPTMPLAAGTVYEWTVEVSDGYSKTLGATWVFTTFNHAPKAAHTPDPEDGDRHVATDQALCWQGETPDVDGHIVRYTLVLTSAEQTVQRCETTAQCCSLPLAPHTDYIWSVSASDGISVTPPISVWHFSTMNYAPELSNLIPVSNSIGVAVTQTLRWSGMDRDDDPLTYSIAFGSYPSPPVVSDTATVEFYDPTRDMPAGQLLTNTTYYWQVWATDGISVTPGGVLSFTTTWEEIPNRPPFEPVLRSPSDRATGVSLMPLLGWNGGDPDRDPVTYTLRMGIASNALAVVGTTTQTTYAINAPLNGGRTYYWQVVATDSHGASTPGPIWQFSTINERPNVPANPEPTDGAISVPLTQTLSWQTLTDPDDPGGNPIVCTIYMSSTYQVTPIAYPCDTLSSYDPPEALDINTTYYWRIEASDGLSVTRGPVWRFTTTSTEPINLPPYEPQPVSPEDGKIDVALNAQLEWLGGDPNKDAVIYTVALWCNDPVISLTFSTQETSYDPGLLLPHTTYHWVITATDGKFTRSGPTATFTTLNNSPVKPHTPSPDNGDTQVSLTQPLCWNSDDPDGEVVTYAVYLGVTTTPPLVATLNDTCYTPTVPFTAATVYHWYITATDSVETVSGDLWTFTTYNQPPSAPYNLDPEDGAINVPLDKQLTWLNAYPPDPEGGPVTHTLACAAEGALPATRTPVTSPFLLGALSPIAGHELLRPHTTYTCTLTVVDNLGAASHVKWSFHTANEAPTEPITPYPEYLSFNVPLTPTLTWEEGDDPDPTEPFVCYTVAFGTTDPPPVVATCLTEKAYTPARQLATATPYYWIITATDTVSETRSQTWQFTTTATPQPNLPPYEPSQPDPPDLSAMIPITHDLSWIGGDPNFDIVTYTVGLHAAGASWQVYTTTETTLDPGQLLTNTTYTWIVTASDGIVAPVVGSQWTFTTTASWENHPPARPVNPTPRDGAIGVSDVQVLSWTGGDVDKDPVTYTISITNAHGYFVTESTTNLYYYPGRYALNTTYYWRVIADDGQAQTASALWRFTTGGDRDNTCPGAPVAIYPWDGQTQVPTDTLLVWDSEDPDGDEIEYQVIFGGSAPPPSLGYTMDKVYDPGTLLAGQIYYWIVFADDGQCKMPKAGTYDWWTFTTVVPPLLPITQTIPADGAVNVPLTQTLAWPNTNSPEYVTYEVAFGLPGALTQVLTNTTQTAYNPSGGLSPLTVYYWIITATNGIDTQVISGSFITRDDVDYPLLLDITPENNATNVPLTDTFRLTGGGSPGHPWVTYTHILSSVTGIRFYLTDTVVLTETTVQWTPPYTHSLPPHTTFRWVITATDGVYTNTRVITFTTANRAPHPPVLNVPEDGALDVALTPTFSWTGQGDPDDPMEPVVLYTLWLHTHNGFVRSWSGLTNTTFTSPLSLTPETVYCWTVSASDTDLESDVAPAHCFTTRALIPEEDYPLLLEVSPENGAINVPVTYTFSWEGGGSPGHPWVTYTHILSSVAGISFYLTDTFSTPETAVQWTPPYTHSLPPHTTLRWVITATDGVYTNTRVITFTTANRAPHPPVLNAPEDGALDVALTPIFAWMEQGDPDDPMGRGIRYSLILSDVNGFVYRRSNIATTYFTLPFVLSAQAVYTWSILANDTVSNSVPAGPWRFTTGDVSCPTMPVPVTPTLGAVNVPITETLCWQSTDPEDRELEFTVYLGPSDDPSEITRTHQFCYTPIPELELATVYYWRVTADNQTCAVDSEIMTFTTEMPPSDKDLAVESILLENNSPVITIINTGTTPITGQFRVDLYVNPSDIPTVTEGWRELGNYGVSWIVVRPPENPLDPEESLQLVISEAEDSELPDSFKPGDILCVQVDTSDEIPESDEHNNVKCITLKGGLLYLPLITRNY